MKRLIWTGISILLLLTACSDAKPTRPNEFTPLTAIQISTETTSIAASTSTKVKVIGDFSGEYTQDITDRVALSSDAPAVAAFNIAGAPARVSGVAPGSAHLTATIGTLTASCPLTVTNATITALAIAPANPTLFKGDSLPLKASGTFSDNSTQDVTFDAAWTSSDESKATVGNTISNKGLLQSIAIGTANITASLGNISQLTQVTVTDPALRSIAITADKSTVLTLSTANMTATGTYSDGTTKDLTNQVSWSSSLPTVATIAANGVVTGVNQGNAPITASLGNISGSTTLKITGGNLTGINLSTTALTLANGTRARLSVTGTFGNGTTRDITSKANITSANSNLITVNKPGGNLALIETVAPGTTTVNVSIPGSNLTTAATVTVTSATLTSLTVSPASLNLAVGTSGRLKATGAFSDGTNQDVTLSVDWTTSADTVAKQINDDLINKGRISGIAASSTPATITAKLGTQAPTASSAVTVAQHTLPLSLTITQLPGSFSAGNQLAYTVSATYADGTTQVVTEDATWSIDNTNIAILADAANQPGQIVIWDSGSTTLNASFGGQTKGATVTVP